MARKAKAKADAAADPKPVETPVEPPAAAQAEPTAVETEAEEAAPVEEPVLEDAPDGLVEVKLVDAPANPLPLYVHGVGGFNLRVGTTHRLPAEAVSALRNSGATIEVKE